MIPVFLLAVLVLGGCSQTSDNPSLPVGIAVGNRAPEFHLTTLQGDNVSLLDFAGKPLLLNFWATWCPPCQLETPFLQKIQDTYSGKGLVILAVDVGEKDSTVQSFVSNHGLSLTIPMDYDAGVTRDYNITTIPRTFFIDKEGIIRDIQPGAFQSVQDIENRLTKIMK
jgi:peroxiredoxin